MEDSFNCIEKIYDNENQYCLLLGPIVVEADSAYFVKRAAATVSIEGLQS